jgi:hypothetical protein
MEDLRGSRVAAVVAAAEVVAAEVVAAEVVETALKQPQ